MDAHERTGPAGEQPAWTSETGETSGALWTAPAGQLCPHTLQEELLQLQERTFSDMAAFAWIALPDEDGVSKPYTWACMVGSQSERSRRMSFRRGSAGLAGTALKLGRYVTADMSQAPAFARECPVMLAEKLQTAIALPVGSGGAPRGVLLLGSRSGRLYGQEAIEQAQAGAFRLIR
ncbi:nitrogen regulatory protein A [Paenibacillus sp. UNCCL117]|uniref:GAF domain-containing protein n=1 Tax=unclassified Paenibacillus TaxID=185978 RepID=UPI00088F7088|nr:MULTISPECIES: GAF domain-containing protein [unclassified Paenibacillus]SDD13818.1 nitrogen regulatory protein A [Paenibacillus sp. cl123]SFW34067.1 nitrogen regulatory protein A [Paenibacillus sp. UNCCL117]